MGGGPQGGGRPSPGGLHNASATFQPILSMSLLERHVEVTTVYSYRWLNRTREYRGLPPPREEASWYKIDGKKGAFKHPLFFPPPYHPGHPPREDQEGGRSGEGTHLLSGHRPRTRLRTACCWSRARPATTTGGRTPPPSGPAWLRTWCVSEIITLEESFNGGRKWADSNT